MSEGAAGGSDRRAPDRALGPARGPRPVHRRGRGAAPPRARRAAGDRRRRRRPDQARRGVDRVVRSAGVRRRLRHGAADRGPQVPGRGVPAGRPGGVRRGLGRGDGHAPLARVGRPPGRRRRPGLGRGVPRRRPPTGRRGRDDPQRPARSRPALGRRRGRARGEAAPPVEEAGQGSLPPVQQEGPDPSLGKGAPGGPSRPGRVCGGTSGRGCWRRRGCTARWGSATTSCGRRSRRSSGSRGGATC